MLSARQEQADIGNLHRVDQAPPTIPNPTLDQAARSFGIKPMAPLTRLLMALLGISIALHAVAFVTGMYGYFEYSQVDESADINEILLSSDIVDFLVGFVQIQLIIFLGIVFLRWIYQINKNLHALSSQPMEFSPGWSIGSYFVPILSLYKPYQAMKEIWTVVHRGTPPATTVLGWWWFLYIISNILGQLSFRLALRADNAPGYMDSAATDIVADGVDIFLSIAALLLVRAISKAYETNYGDPATEPSDRALPSDLSS